KLNMPQGIAIGPHGDVYIADTGNHRIRKITKDGFIGTIAGSGPIDNISDFLTKNVKHEEGGGFSGDGGPATGARLKRPQSIALDSAGSTFFVDRASHRIRKIDGNGVISTIAGNGALIRSDIDGSLLGSFSGDGGPAVAASLNDPSAIAMDSEGNLYIADFHN